MAEIIDINVSEVVENVQITTTENITTVNINKVTGSGASWGEIEGTLSNQTDLQDALDLKANVSELGATAFSNDYNDLDNKPTIPTLTSQLTNDSGFITNVITALGFTPENSANKSTSITTDSTSNTKYPSVKAVFDWANSVFTTSSAVATQITTALVGYATQSFVNTGLATKQDKYFSHKVTTPSSWVTGTLSETEIYRFSIPANTISSESILSIESMLFNKTGVNGFFQVRVKLTTASTMPTGTTEQIAKSPNIAANVRATAIRKKFYVNGDVIKSQGFDSGLFYDEINNTDVISTRTLDRSQTYNVIISVTLNNASDQVRLEGLDFNIK